MSPDDAEEEPDEIDAEPAPQEFRRPKGLLKEPPTEPETIELKSGAASAPPAPAPAPTARMARSVERRPPRSEGPRTDRAEIRVARPTAPPDATPTLRRVAAASQAAEVRTSRPTPQAGLARSFEPPGEFNVKMDQPNRPAPPRVAADPGTVQIRRPEHSNDPKPKLPTAPNEFQVVADTHAKTPQSDRLRVARPRKRIGIVDTTFARFNMGAAALEELGKLGGAYDLLRRTVPGIKDLPVECKLLFEEEDCDLVLACGMVGRMPVDKTCAHEASLAIQWAQLAAGRHILEVFVHEDEAKDEAQLAWLMDRRTREHAQNAFALLLDPDRLVRNAGQGQRQGFDDAGPVRLAP